MHRDWQYRSETDMQAAEYGKLLLNLNNALNAISDLPLRQQLLHRDWRRLLAASMREWLAICAKEQVRLPANILQCESLASVTTRIKPAGLGVSTLSKPDVADRPGSSFIDVSGFTAGSAYRNYVFKWCCRYVRPTLWYRHTSKSGDCGVDPSIRSGQQHKT